MMNPSHYGRCPVRAPGLLTTDRLGLARFILVATVWVLTGTSGVFLAWAAEQPPMGEPIPTGRTTTADIALRCWLESMVWYHGYTRDEITAAVGLSAEDTARALERWNIRPDNRPTRSPDAPLLVLPYPGGRHPRIGFLDGAVRPARETKLSVFTPWDPASYVVVDVPEAVWSNLGLTYLAHTHIPTVWDQQGKQLEALEWSATADGGWLCQRTLPNGIAFGTRVLPTSDALRMEIWLTNGSDQELSDLRVQNCVMLKGAQGFQAQTNENKRFLAPYAVCRAEKDDRWIISAWVPNHRTWGNAPCPCLHSDPKFPDCKVGETQWLRGWLSFYQGQDIEKELARIDATGWQSQSLPPLADSNPIAAQIVDASTEKPVAARLFVQGEDGRCHFARSLSLAGSAHPHDVVATEPKNTAPPGGVATSGMAHTELSPHPFLMHLPAGVYVVRVDAGSSYDVAVEKLHLRKQSAPQEITLRVRPRSVRGDSVDGEADR